MTILVALLAAFSSSAVQEPASPQELLTMLRRADNDGDLEGVMRLYAPDAVLLPPGEAMVSGSEAIRRRYQQMFAATRMEVTFATDAVAASGDLAFIRGRTIGARRATDGKTEELAHKFVMILRRHDGGWRIASLIWNEGAR